MIRALFSAGSGMNAQQLSIDNIANNLANANTVGFKSRSTQFQDLLYQSLLQPGSAASSQTTVPSGLQVGLGTRPAANSVVFSQGNFQQTDNPLDLVIQGKGFFQIKQPDGTVAYTRAGNFQLDKDGNMVSGTGNPLEPAINLPQQATTISIAADGTVSYSQPGQTSTQVAGQIQLANFTNPGGLNSIGAGLFLPTDASGDPTVGNPGGQEGMGTLQQGYVEDSNVSIVQEFINMISSQRAFEANSKVVKAADDMYSQVNNLYPMKWLAILVLAVPLWAQTGPVNRPHVLVPPDVLRGDRVRVQVTCGGVLLQFDAEVESSAHIGENVIVKNPENGRRFVARVEEKGKVFVKK